MKSTSMAGTHLREMGREEDDSEGETDLANETTARTSMLQPRVAVMLGVSESWHPVLFVCRLCSIIPAIWWGLPVAMRLLVQLKMLFNGITTGTCEGPNGVMGAAVAAVAAASPLGSGCTASYEARLRITETFLAVIWVCFAIVLLDRTFGSSVTNRCFSVAPPPIFLSSSLTV
jgi:hypothetical protein